MDAAKWKTLGKLVGSLVAAGVLAAGVLMPIVLGSGIVARNEASRFLDTSCNLKESAPPQKTFLYARDGKTLLATLFSQDRQPVPLKQVPRYLQQALVATEDRRFYQHHGVDLRGLIRSAVSTSSGDTQGGSTLTMQYVKQIRYFQALSIEDPKKQQAAQQAAIVQNLQRKIEDAKCALYFENTKHESKAEILDNYLNIAFFGENSYGIETAAETYFGVPVNRLTLAQSAMLVGLLRAPSTFDPFIDPTAAKARRDEVIQNLVSVGKLSQTMADQQKASPIALATRKPPTVEQGCSGANPQIKNSAFFCEYARTWLENVNGISRADQDTGGYKIITTLDPSIQNAEQSHMNDVVSADAGSTAVLPTVDPKTGDVLAMAASKTFGSGKGQTEQPIFTTNTAYGASTYKLFAILTALGTGVSPEQRLATIGNEGTFGPVCPGDGKVGNGDANENYDSIETMTTAAQKSDNTYFLSLADKMFNCQLQPVVDLMQQLGMTGIDQKSDVASDRGQTIGKVIVDSQRAQQLILGSVPTSPLALAGAYAAVANRGVYNAPAPILSITDANGTDVPLKRTRGTQVVAPQVADQTIDILTGDTKSSDSGTSAGPFGDDWYNTQSSDIAGKTGTADLGKPYSGKNGAVWFVGMTPSVTAAAGIINFDSPSTPNTGIKGMKAGEAYGTSAAQVWIDALHDTLKSKSWSWQSPDDATGVDVPDLTGLSPTDAEKKLAPLGLKLSVLGESAGLTCGSDAAYGTVGFFGPTKALDGSTVTACLSSQVSADPPPPPVQRTTPTRRYGNNNSGNNNSGSGNSNKKKKKTGGGSSGGSTGGSSGGGSSSGGSSSGGSGGTTGGRRRGH